MTETSPLVDDSLGGVYRAAGFGSRLGAGHAPALLVVDAVQAYLRPASPLCAGVDEPVAACLELAETARQAGVPVFLTRVVYDAEGLDGGLFFRKVPALRAFVDGSPDGEFAPGLRAPGDLIVTKQYASAFFATPLASTLHAMGIDTVVVCGLTTSGCVRATATDALNHGFVPIVAAHACGDRDAAVHRANLFDMNQKSADVVDRAGALAVLSAVCESPVQRRATT